MGKRLDFSFQLLADCLVPFIDLALWATWPIRKDDNMVLSRHERRDAPYSSDEFERESICDSCEVETTHTFTKWQPAGNWTAQCETCHDISDVDMADPPEPTALAWTPDEEIEAGVARFREQWPEKWEAWTRFLEEER